MNAKRALHAALYVPVLLFLAAWIAKALFVLFHGKLYPGIYAIPYGVVFWFFCRRMTRAWRGELERPGLDAAVLGVLDALWLWALLGQIRALQ